MKNNKMLIGIDPGKAGGIIFMTIDEQNQVQKLETSKNPETPVDLLDLFKTKTEGFENKDVFVLLERIWGRPGMGGTTMFTMGRSYGHIEMAVLALKFKMETVLPAQWQKHFGVGTKSACATGVIWKNKLKEKAQQLFPDVKVTLAISDALLITEFFRVTRK